VPVEEPSTASTADLRVRTQAASCFVNFGPMPPRRLL